ncbi:MAG TPA: hypothetical protein VMZ92_06085 [Planctomycetota bacterium]|nr:hypothetical protein [Planctomycetota bacterium]
MTESRKAKVNTQLFSYGTVVRFILGAVCVLAIIDAGFKESGGTAAIGVGALGIVFIWHELRLMRGIMEEKAGPRSGS